MAEFFLGEMRWMAFDFAPKYWLPCNGQTLSINQNAALFSLLGTYYGGDGVTTFKLPDMRGRVPLHQGNGFSIGQVGGEERHTLTVTEMPQHNHTMSAYNGPADTGAATTPAGPTVALAQAYAVPSGGGSVAVNRYSSASASNAMAGNELAQVGSNQSHENRQPFVTMGFCIATSGIYPSRN